MYDVITIGTATRDVFIKSSLFKVLKDPQHLKKIGFKTGEAECFALGSKIEIEQPVFTTGGGAANAAVTFSRQGLKIGALVKVGADDAGGAIIQNLKEEKIKPIIAGDEKYGTAYSTILLAPGGERTILVYRGASGEFKKNEIPLRKLRAPWFYISPGTIPIALMEAVIGHLKSKGAMIAMNPSKSYLEGGVKRLKTILQKLDAVIVNREEAAYLTGVDYSEARKIFEKFDEIMPGLAVVTDGPRGAQVSDGQYLYRAGIFKEKKLIDRTGAGDAFGSGFIAGLIEKKDICFALRLATANATSVVEAVGAEAGILSKKDFKNKRWQYLDLEIDPL